MARPAFGGEVRAGTPAEAGEAGRTAGRIERRVVQSFFPVESRSPALPFETVVAALLGAALLVASAASALRWWTRATLPDRRDALDSAALRPRSMVEDAARMRPALASREFEIRSALEDRMTGTTAAFRSLLEAMEHKAASPADIGDERMLDVLDLCFLGKEDRHRRLEEWIVDHVEPEPDEDSPAAAVYREIEANYFETAHQAEASGEPETASRLYARYLALARRLLSRDVPVESLEIQRRLTRAQVRALVLAPQHAFRTETLEDIWHDPPSAFDYLDDSDSGIRSLALLTAAGDYYRRGAFSDAIALIEDRGGACGALARECEFLQAKASFQRSLRLSAPHVRAALAAAVSRFSNLAGRLPANHYLRDDALLWIAIGTRESGDRRGAFRRLEELLRTCPDTDRRELVEDLLDEYAP